MRARRVVGRVLVLAVLVAGPAVWLRRSGPVAGRDGVSGSAWSRAIADLASAEPAARRSAAKRLSTAAYREGFAGWTGDLQRLQSLRGDLDRLVAVAVRRDEQRSVRMTLIDILGHRELRVVAREVARPLADVLEDEDEDTPGEGEVP